MSAAFLLSVVVQYNDPDAPIWMALYGAAALATLWAARKPGSYPWWWPALVGGVALVWALVLLPQVLGKVQPAELFASWEMKDTRVEVGRECGGLLIVAAWMAITAAARLPERTPPRPSG